VLVHVLIAVGLSVFRYERDIGHNHPWLYAAQSKLAASVQYIEGIPAPTPLQVRLEEVGVEGKVCLESPHSQKFHLTKASVEEAGVRKRGGRPVGSKDKVKRAKKDG
jgi:hypothetical protein